MPSSSPPRARPTGATSNGQPPLESTGCHVLGLVLNHVRRTRLGRLPGLHLQAMSPWRRPAAECRWTAIGGRTPADPTGGRRSRFHAARPPRPLPGRTRGRVRRGRGGQLVRSRVAAVARRHGADYVDPGSNLGFAGGVNIGSAGGTDATSCCSTPTPPSRPTGRAALHARAAGRPGPGRRGPAPSATPGTATRPGWAGRSPRRVAPGSRRPASGGSGGGTDFLIGSVLLLSGRGPRPTSAGSTSGSSSTRRRPTGNAGPPTAAGGWTSVPDVVGHPCGSRHRR